MTFTNAQALHNIAFLHYVVWKRELWMLPEFRIFLDTGGKDCFTISASFMYFVTWVWQMVQHGWSAAQCMGHRPLHLQSLFFYGFLSAVSLGNGTTSGCGKLLSRRHPLEAPTRRRKAPFWQASGSDLQSSPQDTQRWGRERTKCGWEVSKASEDSGFPDLSFQLAFDFLLVGEAVHMKAFSR